MEFATLEQLTEALLAAESPERAENVDGLVHGLFWNAALDEF